MIYTDMTRKAILLIFDRHAGQLDKSGIPYVTHPLHVAESMTDEDSTCAALLHDIVEDTGMTFEELRSMGFSERVVNALRYLTHEDGVDYYDYVRHIAENPLALQVKLADLRHNADLTRLTTVTEKDLRRAEKYRRCIAYLEDVRDGRDRASHRGRFLV